MSGAPIAVIGAGIAGQVCAAYLAKRGESVLLLDQNHHAGGNMSGFSRNGYYFDGGDQSFESMGVVFPILRDLLGVGPDDFVKARYRMVSDDFDFFIESPEQVEDALRNAFPNEPGITPLFTGIKEVSRFLTAHYDPWDFPAVNNPGLRTISPLVPWLPKLRQWTTFRHREERCAVIRHPGLRRWLTGVGYYRMPYLFFAGFWHLWSYDYWYPKGGMQHLHDRLTRTIKTAGGTVRFNTLVERINTDSSGRNAHSITTANGETIPVRRVVYAGDYRRLVNSVLGQQHFPPRLVSKVNSARLTERLTSVYLGLDMDDSMLSSILGGAHHPFYFPDYNVVFPDDASPASVHQSMWIALNHFGNHSPAAPTGKSALTLQTFSPYAWEKFWKTAPGDLQRTRTPEYTELKHRVGMEMVGLAEHLVPGLREKIDFMDVGTPLSTERFSLNSEGSSGGWCYDDRESLVWRLTLNRMRTPVRNLVCAGHYTLWPGGVISAALSGKLAAGMLSRRETV